MIGDIIGTNLLTKFHEDRKINVASRKNAPPPGGHVFQPTGIIFELVQDIIGMNLLTKFYEDQTINKASRVLTRFYYSYNQWHDMTSSTAEPGLLFPTHLMLKAMAKDAGFLKHKRITNHSVRKFLVQKLRNANIPPTETMAITGHKNVQYITNYSNISVEQQQKKNAPPLGSHIFQANVIIFEHIQDIIKTNLLTKFHEDWTLIVASRELTRQMLTPHNG
ncbi:hypothetical protein DPMN_186768 [Dreissena polymorpha]|uniref:Tyr recombinase domain-containing protein n=1 Tax=Dreissena polymorpha TaxID=45954 RepID=A0A9D4I6U3_DREPO|nr:hypothetical protein DPMN_186768 [Dreissena polymorpha]